MQIKRLTSNLLLIMATATFIDICFTLFYAPLGLPLSNHVIALLMVIALVEKMPFIVPLVILIILILFVSVVQIRKGNILFPAITTIIYMVTASRETYLVLNDLISNQYFNLYIVINIPFNITLLVLLSIYLIGAYRRAITRGV